LPLSEIAALNAVPIVHHNLTRALSTFDTAFIKTVAYITEQAGNKVAIFSGMDHGYYSWFDVEQSLKAMGRINLLHLVLPCTDYKRKRKSMEDEDKKDVLVLNDIRASAIPHFPSITHIIVPWVHYSHSSRVYNDFVNHATRYGIMVKKPVVVIKIIAY
jgi:hypothetical protein